MKKVGVIILNYKVASYCVRCIESVKRSTYEQLKIYLVDNDSGREELEELEKIQGVEFIESGSNLGYSGGNNLGIQQALSEGCELVFIINPDAIVEKKAIENLVVGLDRLEAGIAAPKIYFEGSEKIWYAGGIFDKQNVLGSHRGVNEVDAGNYEQEGETDYATGAAMLVKKDVFEKVGVFDERFFLYYEDADLCFRAKQAGFKVVYVPKAIAYHANAKSTGLGSPVQDYYITRNRMLLAKKYLPLRTQLALFREALKNIGQPMRRKALFDFWSGKFGKGDI